MSAPSLAQLFRRSRYSRFDLAGEDDQKQNQQRLEIFAVAAVGFVLKHDPQFKKKFLNNLADIEEDAKNFEPTIQAANCMDLKLENHGKRILVAFEFKVGAELEDHRNP